MKNRLSTKLLKASYGGCAIALVMSCIGCGDAEPAPPEIGQSALELTQSELAAALGFESPLTYWSAPGALAASSTASQGTQSLAVPQPNSWLVVSSVPLSSVGQVGSTTSYDLFVPSGVQWGTAQLFVSAPSLQIHNQSLGNHSLNTLVPNQFNTLSFNLPPEIQTKLSGSYNDLTLSIVINGPNRPQPYLLDNFKLGQMGTPPPSLTIEGTSSLMLKTTEDDGGPIVNDSSYHFHLFDGTFTLTNTTSETLTLGDRLFFFAGPGSYSFLHAELVDFWGTTLGPGAVAIAGPFGWGFSPPITHLVTRVEATTASGVPVTGVGAVPVIEPGGVAPPPADFSGNINIGAQAPLRVLQLTDGRRWIDFTGSVIDMTADSQAAAQVSGRLRNAAGQTVVQLGVSVNKFPKPPELPIQPIHHFRAWAEVPAGATPVDVEISASQAGVAGGTATQTRVFALATDAPVQIASPLAGAWHWDNGPGLTSQFAAHWNAPEATYGYDLCQKVLNGAVWQSFQGDPSQNESYLCWEAPIRAALPGTVVYVNDSFADNDGNQFNVGGPNNLIVIDHGNNLFSNYAHMKQGSALVQAGQTVAAGTQLAVVGNAGQSSGPHLHFHVYRKTPTGYIIGVPFTVSNMTAPNGSPVSGVPASNGNTGNARWITP